MWSIVGWMVSGAVVLRAFVYWMVVVVIWFSVTFVVTVVVDFYTRRKGM